MYEFLEEDDDFEEFEMGADYDEHLNAGHLDSEMNGDGERKMWQQDWDDEEQDEDFGAKLRAQLGM